MQAEQAMVIVRAYDAHQVARKRMKTMSHAVERNPDVFLEGAALSGAGDMIAVVENYINTGEALDAAIISRGIVLG